MARLSKDLRDYFFSDDRVDYVTFADIMVLAKERTFGIVFIILSFPSALPVPAPGYSTPFGIVIMLIAAQMIMGRDQLWLPARIRNAKIELRKVRKILNKGLPFLEKIEIITRPRMVPICSSQAGKSILGMVIIVMALSMCLIIPGTNTLPAFGIFVIGFGLLDDDGLLCLGGIVVSILAATVTTAILILIYRFGMAGIDSGSEALKILFEKIFGS